MIIPCRPLTLGFNLLKLALFLLLTSLAFAQQNTGALRGQVTDQLGGAAVGATVTAVEAKGVEKIVITDNEGGFVFSNLPREMTGAPDAGIIGRNLRSGTPTLLEETSGIAPGTRKNSAIYSQGCMLSNVQDRKPRYWTLNFGHWTLNI